MFTLFAVPDDVKGQYEDNLRWIEEAHQHHLVRCLLFLNGGCVNGKIACRVTV